MSVRSVAQARSASMYFSAFMYVLAGLSDISEGHSFHISNVLISVSSRLTHIV